MTAIVPRDYQIAAVQHTFAFLNEHAVDHTRNPLIALPTGTGKSVVIAGTLHSLYWQYPTVRCMVLTHVKELIAQNFQKLLDVWPQAPAGVYSAGLGQRDTWQKIIFAGIASVAKRANEFGNVSVLFIDEAHLVSPSDETMYRTFIEDLRKVNPYLRVVGYTATPWRLGHGKITEGGLFTDVCFDMTSLEAFNWLLAEGYLCPLVPKSTSAKLDTSGVHIRGGEFVAGELQQAVDKQEVTYAALKETMELGHDRQHWLLFCAGVEHATHVSEMLNAMGVPCAAVHNKMPSAERDKVLRDFKSGKLRAVANNNVLTTGFDHPGLDLIVMLRPTASSVLWVQMLGRGTRPLYPAGYDVTTKESRLAAIAASIKQNCLVLDFAGNTRRLGPINDPVIPRKKGEKGGDAPVKLCEVCNTYNHASLRHCCNCGSAFPEGAVKLRTTAGTEELIKGDMPVVKEFKVDHITYSPHEKAGNRMVKVSYYSGLRLFQEYVCVGHSNGFARRKAAEWWRARAPGQPVPATADDLLELAPTLPAATHLRVWVNKQNPEIMAHCLDGTAWGTQAATEGPQVGVSRHMAHATAPAQQPARAGSDDMDDDIPF